MSSILLRLAAVSGLAIAALPAQVEGFNDLRFTLGIEGNDYTTDVTASAGGVTASASDDDSFDNAGHLGVAWVASPGLASGGLLYGGGLRFARRTQEDNGVDLTYDAFTVRGHAGWGYGFSEQLQLEILPFLGLGAASLDLESSTDSESFSGFYAEAGLDLNLVFTAGNGFQVGGSVGWLFSSGSYEEEISGIDVDFDIEQSVPTGGVFIGFRF